MEVWYLDNQDSSGVFSSKQKALDSFHAGAERCGWRIIDIEDDEGWTTITYAYLTLGGEWKIDTVDILMYNLDEDNFGE